MKFRCGRQQVHDDTVLVVDVGTLLTGIFLVVCIVGAIFLQNP